MHLGNGLEEIEEGAFYGCTSLLRIEIPPLVRVIKHGAFAECSGLGTAILGDGLEEIEAHAFHACTSFLRITIPPTVGTINEMAFNECSGLMNVVFCNVNKEFASGAGSMRDWWNNGRCGIGGITGSTISAQVRIAFSSDATFRNAWVLYYRGCGIPKFTAFFGAFLPSPPRVCSLIFVPSIPSFPSMMS